MNENRSIKLFGTDAPSPEVTTLRAGPLSVELEGGALRYLRWHGFEAIRAIDYLVRDENWATPPARLSSPAIVQDGSRFEVSLTGEVQQDSIDYRYEVAITGTAEGRLEVRIDGEARKGFATNRTGFSVLHPIKGVAGAPARVEHADGSIEETAFPLLISPGQPMMDIRSIRHGIGEGMTAECRMEASLPHDPATVFEMEDQRNWSDASYKTYVGSLLDPWPYRIEAGQRVAQKITITLEGAPANDAAAATGGDAALAIGDAAAGPMPAIGIGVMPDQPADLKERDDALDLLRPAFITAYAESDAADLVETLGRYAGLATRLGADVFLELVLHEESAIASQLDHVASACRSAGLAPRRVLPCPRAYLKSVQPSGPWPPVTDLGHIYNAARRAFPDATIAGGMLSYFTELNRKRPPMACVDLVSCTTTPIVHAADDRSVMETTEALPDIVASMQAIAEGKPVHLGPSALSMRHNPYGAAPVPNPGHERIAMAANDPRQRGLFGAAWAMAYAAATGAAGVQSLALNFLSGPSGVIATPQPCSRPWFDEADAPVYPVFHVMRALFAMGGSPRLPMTGLPAGIAGIAAQADGGRRVLLANTGGETVTVPTSLSGKACILDTASFKAACKDPAWLDNAPRKSVRGSLELESCAVAFLET